MGRGGLSKRRQAESQKIYLGPVWAGAAEGQGIANDSRLGRKAIAPGRTRLPRLSVLWTSWPAGFLPHKGAN